MASGADLKGTEVVVVGAGWAGLAAASRLVARGARVRVLERAEESGGRALGHHALRLSTGDRRLLSLVRGAGLDDALPLVPWSSAQVHEGRIVPVERGRFGGERPPGLRALDELRLVRLPRLLGRFAADLDRAAPERAAGQDDRCVRDFGALYFGRSAVERWMQPWLGDLSPVSPDTESRVSFLARFAAEAGAAIGDLKLPMAHAADSLGRALAVRQGHAVDTVTRLADGGLRVTADGANFDAAAVVLALPAPEALRIGGPLLASVERDYLSAVRYRSAFVCRLEADAARLRPLALGERVRIRVPRAEVAELLSLSWTLAAGADGGGVITAVGPGVGGEGLDRSSDEAIARAVRDRVASLLPGALLPGGSCELSRAPAAWPGFEVGRYRAIAQFQRVQADRRAQGRRLYFAGDHLTGPSLECAVASGERAAQDLIADIAGTRTLAA